MNQPYLNIYLDQVALSALVVVFAMVLAWVNRANLEKQYLIGALRSFIQLWLVGYVLFWLFQSKNPVYLLLTIEVMIVVGTWTAVKRQKLFSLKTFGFLILSLHTSVIGLGVYLFWVVLRVGPFDYPHLFIPLMGMVIGNSANGASLALHRLRGEIKSHRGEIEAALALGASPRKSIEPYVSMTLQNALIPMINNMMMMGIVQLPGIMTGQMISGVIPQEAVRYQIIVVYLLSGTIALTCHLTVKLEAKKYFTSHWSLNFKELM